MKIKKGAHQVIFRSNVVKNKNVSPSVQSDAPNSSNISSQPVEQNRPPFPPEKKEPMVVINDHNHTKKVVPATEVSPVLLSVKGNWPFDLAPDELIIEEHRIVLKRNYFPIGGSLVTIPFHTLASFEINHAFFYSAIYIKGGEGNSVNEIMQWIKPSDAIRAKEIVDGLRLKEEEKIEIEKKDKKSYVETLQRMGHA